MVDEVPTLAELDQKIIYRSLALGVKVLSAPNDGDLTVMIDYPHFPSAMLADEGIVLEFDSGGEICAAIVMSYEDLFSRRPILASHYENFVHATTHEVQQDYGLRLFHCLLVISDSSLATLVRKAYEDAEAHVAVMALKEEEN